MSKLLIDIQREELLRHQAELKKIRKFTEMVELQNYLKNYKQQKDKCFSGSVKLPHIHRPKMKICMLGDDAQHVEEGDIESNSGSDWDNESDSEKVPSVWSMAEDDVLPSARQAPGDVGGMMGFPPSDVGSQALRLRWAVQGYNVEFVDGRFVPVCHLGLYRRILVRYGHLASGAVMEGMPLVVMAAVSETLDMIAEIEGVRDTELSREHVDAWSASLRSASIIGLSVGWLRSRIEQLDRTVRRLELVTEARREAPELVHRMEVVVKKRVAAESELEEVMARVAKARDEEKEIHTAMAANIQVLDDADNEPMLTGQSVLSGFL